MSAICAPKAYAGFGRRYPAAAAYGKIRAGARKGSVRLDARLKDWLRPLCYATSLFAMGGALLGIVKNPFAALAPQAAGFDVLHQQRAGPELLSQRFMQIFEDMQAGIEPDQID